MLRTLELSDVVITSLGFDYKTKLVIVGTNTGLIGYYESDTGKLTRPF